VEFGQMGVAMNAGDLLQHRAGDLVAFVRSPVGDRGDQTGELAVAVGLGQFASGEGNALVLRLDRTIPQHQMGEVEIEVVRRHIRAFGHVAHVAQRAGIDDRLELFRFDVVNFARLGGVDHVEQAGETVAQIEAAPAAMADVEYPAQLGIQLRLVIEIRILPVDGMADRGFETAFPHGATPYLFVLGLRATV
jgi:hypothetical protein